MRKRLIGLALAVVLALTLLFPVVAFAANPEVAITVYGDIIAITNTQTTWAIGHVQAGGAAVYFSATGAADPDYSSIENTGNQPVDIQIQGTDIEGGTYDWTLANTGDAGDQIYSLYANSVAAPTVYDVRVKSATYGDLTTNLDDAAETDNYAWSMMFTPPTAFNAADDGAQKSATITLVARLHV